MFYLIFVLVWWAFSKHSLLLAIPLCLYLLVCNLLPLYGVYQKIEFFILGFFCAHILKSGYRIGLTKLGSLAPLLFGILVFCFLPAVQRHFGVELPKSGWESYSYLLFVAISFILVIECRSMQRIFEAKSMRFLGKISFSVYLMHLLVLNGMEYYGWLQPSLGSFLMAMLLVVLLSTLTYSFIENPLRYWIRKAGRPRVQ